jgi:hypothetical protein
MSDKYTRKQGETVKFKLSETIELTGEVNGQIGPMIIVKLNTPLKDYPFTHIYIVDSQIV